MPRGVPKNGFRKTQKWMERQGMPTTIPTMVNTMPTPVPVMETVVEDIPTIEVKIRDTFSRLRSVTRAVGSGRTHTNSLFVSGQGGLGKSHTINSVLNELEMSEDINVKYIGGYCRPIEMYRTMYNYRFSNCVIVFDDSDYIFGDETSLNMLKHLTDSRKVRVIDYMAQSIDNLVDEDGESIPKSFEFEGRVIFLTNYDFYTLIDKNTKFSPHLKAMTSRGHYIDIGINTPMEYFVRIRQVVEEDKMLEKMGVSTDDQHEVIEFIRENIAMLRDRSVRVVNKVVDCMLIDRANWKADAKAMLCYDNG